MRKCIVDLNDKSVSVATLNFKCIWITIVRSDAVYFSVLFLSLVILFPPAAAIASPLIRCGSRPQLILSNLHVSETNDGPISFVNS